MYPFSEPFARIEDAYNRERMAAYFDHTDRRARRKGARRRTIIRRSHGAGRAR